jgi:hypothetical protein
MGHASLHSPTFITANLYASNTRRVIDDGVGIGPRLPVMFTAQDAMTTAPEQVTQRVRFLLSHGVVMHSSEAGQTLQTPLT